MVVEIQECFGWVELAPGRAFIARLPDGVVGKTHEDGIRAVEVGKLDNSGLEVKLQYTFVSRVEKASGRREEEEEEGQRTV